MHGRSLVTVLVALALGATVGSGGVVSTGRADAAPPGHSPAERSLLVAMNAARSAHRLPPLRLSPLLSAPARSHSASLATARSLDHDGPNGEPFWARLVEAGFARTKWMGENLALVPTCRDSAGEVVRMWLRSPGHRANLLSRRFRVVGAGVVSAEDCETTVFTADFGG